MPNAHPASAAVTVVPTPDPLGACLAKLGIFSTTYAHPPVFRVGEDDDFIGQIPGGHSKNLFLKDKKDTVWLVSAVQDTVVDLKWLRNHLSCPSMSFGKPELLMELLGVVPGSVTPFALLNDTGKKVRIVLDSRLMGFDTVNFHPLKNDKTTNIKPQDLLRFLADLGYDPLIVNFEKAV